MKNLCLAVFVVSTAVHLWASLRKDGRIRNLTKPFILLSLLGFYVLAARSVSTAVVLALFFSWLGDLLLIPKGSRCFASGGIAFMISHAFLILGYAEDLVLSRVSGGLILLLALFFAAVIALVFSRLKEHLPKALFYPMLLYLLINAAMNCFAILRCVGDPCAATLTTAVGAALFFVSDTVLFFVRFKKDSRLKTHFLVMLTYSVGELLIVLGMLG